MLYVRLDRKEKAATTSNHSNVVKARMPQKVTRYHEYLAKEQYVIRFPSVFSSRYHEIF